MFNIHLPYSVLINVTKHLVFKARQVREVFPDAPLESVMEDLQRTRTVQGTLENIIEGIIPMVSIL